MSRSAAFLARLGIQLPLVQAPMAGVATPELAAAVSNAGALGSLGIGPSTVEQAQGMIEKTRALTARPFNVNLFCHAPAVADTQREAAWLEHLQPLFDEAGLPLPTTLKAGYPSFPEDDAMLQMLLKQRPAIVSFHFGLPQAEQITALREAGICLLATATNLHEAKLIEDAGLDGIVAQGIEAGGHRGTFDPEAADEQWSTSVLVRLLTQRCALPVIAAGGIMDGQGIRAALDLGAAAAQLGTAFVLCPESSANAAYRQALQSEPAEHTRLTASISGRPARGMLNRLIEHGEAAGRPLPAGYPMAYDAAKQLNAAASQQNNHEFAAHWAGMGAPLARQMPAAELIAQLVREMTAQG
ncbi:MAG: nitronate monooxygenase [Pseudomonas sp.]